MAGMARERIVFLAAFVRFVLAALGLLLIPVLAPSLVTNYLVFVGYVVCAGVFQVLIWRDLFGTARTIVSGIVDAALITFVVHLVGSIASMTVALYAFGAMLNTVIAGRRIGAVIAAICAVMYATLLALEGSGALAFAPAGPSWIHGVPTPGELASSGALAITMIFAGTLSVGALVAHDEKRAEALVEANRKLEDLSQRDALTGLHNRRHLMLRLEEELRFRRRGRPLSVVMLDLDHFKRVNDEEGHGRGDTLLATIADALSRAVRATDVLGRYGGDEFVVLLPDTEPAQAEIVAHRVVLGVREVGLGFDAKRPVTASVGLAVATETDEPRALLQRADRAAYVAKARGGDRLATEAETLRPPPRAQA